MGGACLRIFDTQVAGKGIKQGHLRTVGLLWHVGNCETTDRTVNIEPGETSDTIVN